MSSTAHRRAKMTTRSEMPPPITLLKLREVFKQFAGLPPLDFARSQLPRCRDQGMDVILALHTFDDPYLKRLARLQNQLPDSLPRAVVQNRVTIFRNPHKVVLKLEHRVAAVPVV